MAAPMRHGERGSEMSFTLTEGGIAEISIYGHKTACRVLRIRRFGTIDVERLSDGRCFRITGLKEARRP